MSCKQLLLQTLCRVIFLQWNRNHISMTAGLKFEGHMITRWGKSRTRFIVKGRTNPKLAN